MLKEELSNIYKNEITIEDMVNELCTQKLELEKKLSVLYVLRVIEEVNKAIDDGILNQVSNMHIEASYDDGLGYYVIFMIKNDKPSSNSFELGNCRLAIEKQLNNLAQLNCTSEYFSKAYHEPVNLRLNIEELSKEEIEKELLDKLLIDNLKPIYLADKLDALINEKCDNKTNKHKI